MRMAPFLMEEWLSGYRFAVRHNLAESGLRDLTLNALLALCGGELSDLGPLVLEDQPTMGTPKLRQAIAQTYPDLDPERVWVTTGTSEALFVFFNLVLNAGDEVLCSFPAFQALYEVPRAIGAKLVFYEHRLEEGFRFDGERFCSLITPKTRLVIVNNPHNPTGAVADRDTLAAIARRAAEVGATMLCDEHYRFLPHDPTLDLLPSGVGLGPQVFATGSITKCFGAMGLRMGWLVGEPDFLRRARDQRDYLTHTLSPLSEHLAALAITNRAAVLAESRRILGANKAALGAFMAAHGEEFDYVPPQAGVVCFPRYKRPIASRELVRRMIEETGVFCLPGHSFEAEGFLRFGLGPEPESFAAALEKLCGFFA